MLRDMSDTLAFVEVVERGSFTAAAESFRTSKARISKKVQDLEQRLGVKLLHRTTRNIRLTEAGSIYFDRCRDLARLIGDAESAVEQVHGKPSGWLRVTAPHWLVTKAIAPLMVGFREAYPEVKLQLLLDHYVKNIVQEDIVGTMPVIALVATNVVPTQVLPLATAGDVRAAGLQSGHMRILMSAANSGPPSVVHVRDTLLLPDAQPAADIARPAFVLDAQTPVYEALARMRESSVQIAIVMQSDAVCGIVTLADILKRVLPAGIAAQKAVAATKAA